MRPPLVVHIIHHPDSVLGAEMGRALDRALTSDPAVAGLRLPTRFAPEDGSGLPPAVVDLDAAGRSFVVLLATDEMAVAPDSLPAGRRTWGELAASTWRSCQANPGRRFVPLQLTEYGWPLHDDLSQVSFARLWAIPEERRQEHLVRSVLVELCRFLAGCEAGGAAPAAPITLFISHTKLDRDREPPVVEALLDHLKEDQPVEAWFDSGDIPAGSRFSAQIEQGVERASLLSVLTDNYATRSWCRKEILLAKDHQRPLVVIDALQTMDLRSFPYIGNVPVLRWSEGAAFKAVDLVLKETVRQLHALLELQRLLGPGEIAFPSPPELATVLGQEPRPASILYPDPPLSEEEAEVVDRAGVPALTPLQRVARGPSRLKGLRLALSSSESSDLGACGLLQRHQDETLIELSRHLLLRGATLAYGGHLGKEGYTVRLFDLVRSHGGQSGLPPVERIVNYVGWPLPLTIRNQAQYAREARFAAVPRPDDLADAERLDPALVAKIRTFVPASSPERRFAWARGMSAMRQRQTAETDARICLGGPYGPSIKAMPDGSRSEKWYASRIPGVLEEALCSLQARQPLYLVGAFGGATRLAIDLIEGRDRPEFSWECQKGAPHAEAMRGIYDQRGVPWLGYQEMAAFFAQVGVEGLARINGLSVEENRELFVTPWASRVVELVLTGVGCLTDRAADPSR